GVDGYYVRIASLDGDGSASSTVIVKNVPVERREHVAAHLVSPDVVALVRFGLRAADDPRIVDTLKIIDALLKVETPNGPSWHRYNGDGYGEHEDGSPFDGTGIGRLWPLLTAERAHYELAAGRSDEARRLLAACEAFANDEGLLPEQIWDSPDIPERELFFGKPSGSAMPLVWAHGEYVKLCRSLRDGRVFDLPPQTVQRYLVEKTESPRLLWRFNHKIGSLPAGKSLRIETLAAAVVHFTSDEWRTAQDLPTKDIGFGIHVADLPAETLNTPATIRFTFYWPEAGHWEGEDFAVKVSAAGT
ncbi:MAG TPA: glycoside hydrolase family 15 protein, partial [Gammaproteobacteria bacterium]|nr:glycoside hydrolase family 15 protein [Gammaproteobacteria bacterium]